MADESNFDAEMNALMGVEPTQPTAPAPAGTAPANPSPAEKSWKAGGREWKSPDDLAKAHDSLVREFGSRNKDWQELADLRKMKEQLGKDPQFNSYLKTSIEAYQRARDAGQPQATAQAKTGLPDDVVKKIERFESLADSVEFEREEQSLVRKFKLDDPTLRKVGEYSLARGGIPLEQSYKEMMFDLNQQKLEAQRAHEKQKKQDVSRTATPSAAHMQPSTKGPSLKGDADWRKSAGDELSKFYSE